MKLFYVGRVSMAGCDLVILNLVELIVTALAEKAEVDPLGRLNIIGAFNALKPNELPVILNADLALTLLSPPAEQGTEKAFQFVLLDEDGRKGFDFEISNMTPLANPRGSVAHWSFVVQLRNIRLNDPGTYQISILVNGIELRSIPIYLHHPEAREV